MAEGEITTGVSSKVTNKNILPSFLSFLTRRNKTISQAGEIKENIVEKDIYRERAQAFMRQRYPLSEAGQALKSKVKKALLKNNGQLLKRLEDQLPTVERPNLSLFKDFDLTTEQKDQIFGTDLTNVQVTKGCSHKCSFCAAGSETKIETMPFIAVLKAAEQMRAYEKKVDEAWESWQQIIERIGLGNSLMLVLEYREDCDDLSRYRKSGLYTLGDFIAYKYPDKVVALKREFETHPIRLLSDQSISDKAIFSDKDLWNQNYMQLLLEKEWLFKKKTINYYDGDPFDYKDATMLHQDGSPADYGDVFIALASDLKPIHITTAGWAQRNKTAIKAAEKITALCKENPELASTFRLSVNKYEYRAREDYDEYIEDMKKTITGLMSFKGGHKVLFCYDENNPEDQEFIKRVVRPLEQFMKDYNIPADPVRYSASFYSGHMGKEDAKSTDPDIMACSPGIHIWSDGTIARQDYKTEMGDSGLRKKVEKGSRPQPLGMKLYSLSQ